MRIPYHRRMAFDLVFTSDSQMRLLSEGTSSSGCVGGCYLW